MKEKKYRFCILTVDTWDPSDWFSGESCDPMFTDTLIFSDRKRAEEYIGKHYGPYADEYHDASLRTVTMGTQEAREAGWYGHSGEEEFGEWLGDLADSGTDAGESDLASECIAGYDAEYIDVPNFDFDQSLEGHVLVSWQWETHVGYCRRFLGLRIGLPGDTYRMTCPEDRCYREQVSDLGDGSGMTEDDLYDAMCIGGSWKWANPRDVLEAIGEFAGKE